MGHDLGSWKDTATREAIAEFVESAAASVAPEERVADFDNDGTLWCEKLEQAKSDGWTVISMKSDWSEVFSG